MSTTVALQTATGKCHRHGSVSADWACTSCGAEYCDACIQENARDRACLESCPKCREFCRRVSHTGARGPISSAAMVMDAVAFPF